MLQEELLKDNVSLDSPEDYNYNLSVLCGDCGKSVKYEEFNFDKAVCLNCERLQNE